MNKPTVEERMSQQLGDDIAAIRARVLGERARSSNLTAEEQASVTEGLRAAVQTDLDTDLDAVEELEDPGLKAHIAAQRRALSEYQKKLKEIPSRHELDRQFSKSLRELSGLIMNLDTSTREIDDAAIMAHKRAEALSSIKAAGTPRNAPPNPWKVMPKGANEFLQFFENEAEKTAQDFTSTKNVVVSTHRAIFKLRREFELAFTNLLKRVDLLDEERQRLREHLRDLAKK